MNKKTLLFVAAGVILCGLAASAYSFVQTQTAKAFVAFLNVGQGDAILIQSKTNETVLIDSGPDDRVIYELGQTLPANDRVIETLVLTHPDLDHTGGAFAVLTHFTVKRVITSGLRNNSITRKIMAEIARKKIPLIAIGAHDDFTFENGEQDGFFDVLYPLNPIVFSSVDANNDSVVLRFTLGELSFLFTGDIEAGIENILVKSYGKNLQTQILKLAHHGSKTSSTLPFLQAVAPELAIASAGKNNKFHHPSTEVIERLKDLHIPLRVTKEEGRIVINL